MTTANDSTLTAEAALDEALNRVFGSFSHGWRAQIAAADTIPMADDAQVFSGSHLTYGDLRRWSAPLRNS